MSEKNTTKCRPTENHPELVELLADLANFTSKWTGPKIAKTVGISKERMGQIKKERSSK